MAGITKLGGGGHQILKDGVAVNQRSKVDLKQGSNLTITPVDNSGADSTELTFASSGGGGTSQNSPVVLGGGYKSLLAYIANTDLLNNAAIPATTWTDILGNQNFTVNASDSIIAIAVRGSALFSSDSGVGILSNRVVIDSGGTPIYRYLGGDIDNATGQYINPFGDNTVYISGLVAGVHTIKIQVYGAIAFHGYLRASTNPNTEFLSIDIIENFLGQTGGGISKIQLDYALASDLNQTIPATTWTDFIANQNFTIDDPNSIIEIDVRSKTLANNPATAAETTARIVIDSAATPINKMLGGGFAPAAGYGLFFGGVNPIVISGLAAGVHTVKIQLYTTVSVGAICRPVAFPDREFLSIQIIERKPAQQTSILGGGEKLLLDYATSTDLFNGTVLVTNTWTDLIANQIFVTSDPNSIIRFVIDSGVNAQKATTTFIIGLRIVIDSAGTPNNQLVSGRSGYDLTSFGSGVVSLPSGALLPGTHTVKVQVIANTNAAIYLRTATRPNDEFLRLQVIESFQGATGGGISKQQLGYVATTDLANALAITTWTDILGNQTFNVDDGRSLIDISVLGNIMGIASAAGDFGSRIVIDSAGTPINIMLGGFSLGGAGRLNFLTGTSFVSVQLPAGSHTIKVQVNGGSVNAYCRAATNPNSEFLSVRVIERKPSIATVQLGGGSKKQLDYALSVDQSALTPAASTWTNFGPSVNFTVDEATSVVTAYINALIDINATTGNNVGAAVLIDSVTRYIIGNGYVANSGLSSMPVSNPGLPITGLTAGIHTIQLQVWSGNNSVTFNLRPASFPNFERLDIRIVEQYQGGSGGGISKQQLDYRPVTDIINGVSVGTPWTDLIANQNFTVDNGLSLLEFSAYGQILAGTANSRVELRLVIDSASTPIYRNISGTSIVGTTYWNALTGSSPFSLSGLAAGIHTVKLQAKTEGGTLTFYCRPGTQTDNEFLGISIIERKPSGQERTEYSSRVYNNANIAAANGTNTKLTFNTSRYNYGSIWDSVNNRFLIPVAGRYRLSLSVRIAANANGKRSIYFYVNGTTIICYERKLPNASDAVYINVSTEWDFQQGDYIEAYVHQDSGGSLNVEFEASDSPEFSISKVF